MDNFSNIDSSQDESLSSTFDFINNKIKQGLNIMLPCQVLAVDRKKNRVKVLPLIALLKTNGETMNRAIIDDIPICNLSAGGFIINFPIKVGDFGYIKSNDRDISLFKQSYKNSKPNTTRKNDFADSIFIPDVINQNLYDISGEDSEALVIQSYDNSTKISMSNGKIILQADTIEQRATNHIFTNGTIKHDGTSIDKNHTHMQNAGDHFGAGVDTTPPDN